MSGQRKREPVYRIRTVMARVAVPLHVPEHPFIHPEKGLRGIGHATRSPVIILLLLCCVFAALPDRSFAGQRAQADLNENRIPAPGPDRNAAFECAEPSPRSSGSPAGTLSASRSKTTSKRGTGSVSGEQFIGLCGNGTPSQVAEAIKAGADVRSQWFETASSTGGWTPLMFAARENQDPEVLTVLLKAGADVNARTTADTTPLMIAAAANRNPEVAAVLVKAGANVDAKDIGGWTPLFYAVRYNPDPKFVTILLRGGADPNARNEKGATPLLLATEHSDWRIATLLMKGGADPNTRDAKGDPPLFSAVMNNPDPRMTAALLKGGADVNAKTGDPGRSYAGTTVLMHAARWSGDETKINLLLAAGAELEARNGEGATALIVAARYNSHPEIITTLLNAGADAKARDRFGRTAFDYAGENRSLRESAAFLQLKESPD